LTHSASSIALGTCRPASFSVSKSPTDKMICGRLTSLRHLGSLLHCPQLPGRPRARSDYRGIPEQLGLYNYGFCPEAATRSCDRHFGIAIEERG
jgi:hypothetical protein